MESKGINEAFIGNGKLLAGLSSKGELLRIAYPSVDFRQNLNFFHVGIRVNESNIIYLHDDINNHYTQEYIENTNILSTNIENSYFNIEINQIDFVKISEDLIIRQYTLKNNNTIDMDVNFLIHSELTSGQNNPVSGVVFEDSLLQYTYDYTFAIFSDKKINSKQIHNTKENIVDGVIFRKRLYRNDK